MTRKKIKILAEKIGEERILRKLLEEMMEASNRNLQISDGRDKESEFILELGDTLTWINLYIELKGVNKFVNSHVNSKLNKLNKLN